VKICGSVSGKGGCVRSEQHSKARVRTLANLGEVNIDELDVDEYFHGLVSCFGFYVAKEGQ
jgi:hypothetical protein